MKSSNFLKTLVICSVLLSFSTQALAQRVNRITKTVSYVIESDDTHEEAAQRACYRVAYRDTHIRTEDGRTFVARLAYDRGISVVNT
ncbi:MAG: hypothetical protein ACOC0N_03890, partial [Chroococcales cyanobacterium]